MALRVGEMMVIVRAQDFASRTLRRVGGEFSHMSRKQAMLARQADIMFQKQQAQSKIDTLGRERKRLELIERRNRLEAHNLRLQKQLTRASERRAELIQRFPLHKSGVAKFGTPIPVMKELYRTEQQIKSFGDQISRRTIDLGRFNAAIQKMPSPIRAAASSTAMLGEAFSRNSRNLAAAEQALTKAQRAQLAHNAAVRAMPINRLHDLASALGGIGRTFQLFGAIGVGGFGLAAREAATFSQATSLAATQVTRIGAGTQEAIDNAGKLRERILALAKDYPFAAEEMSQATYEIFSSTNIQNIDQGMGLLEAFARVGVAGQVDIATATKASITVLNTFRGATDDVGATLNRMFSIVRFGRMRFADFAAMLPKVAAAAYGSGQSLDDVAGIMAFLTRKTGDAGIAATQISRAFDVLGRKEFRVGIEKLGVSIEDAHGKLLPLPEVLKRIMDRWGGELKSGGKASERFIQIVTRAADPLSKGLLSTAEARRFFRFVFSDFDTYLDLQDKAVKNNKEFQRSFETMMADPGVRWQIFVARIRAGIIQIGQAAIPAFEMIGEKIAAGLDKWERLDKHTRDLIVKWGVLGSAGMVLAGIILSVGGAFISVALAIGGMLAKLVRVAAAFFGLSALLGGTGAKGLIGRLILMTKLLTFIAGIGAITIGIKLEQQGDGWAFIGKVLETGGMASLLKKAGMAGVKRATGAGAILTELIWPEDAGPKQIPTEKMRGFINDLDNKLAGTMKKSKLMKIQREASRIFETTLMMKGGTFTGARIAVLAYLRKQGVAVDDSSKKVKTNTEQWKEWSKNFEKILGKAGGQAMMKALGLDDQTLAGVDDKFDQIEEARRQHVQATKDWQKQLVQATKDARVQVMDNLQQMYTQMEEVNRQAFGQIFQGPWLTSETFDIAKEWGITPQIDDLIKDLDQQLARFSKWQQSLNKLGKRGFAQDFVNEMRQMGPEEGQGFLDAILSGSPAKQAQLIRKLNLRNKTIQSQTKMDFADEIGRFRKAGGSMGDAIINGFQDAQVGQWFDGWIKGKFPDIISTAVSQAVTEWKTQNPRPTLPASAMPTGGAAPGSRTGPTTANDDHSKKWTVNMTLPPFNYQDIVRNQLAARQVAFAARNVLRTLQ